MPASRSVVSVLVRALGELSLLSSRPALRAAQPPAALRPGDDTPVTGGTGLTLHGSWYGDLTSVGPESPATHRALA
jgi:hypothetical protein